MNTSQNQQKGLEGDVKTGKRLTLFACPKPFHGKTGVIQRNAVRSWVRLRPQPQVILFGDDHGTKDCAAALEIRHVPEIRRHDYGTPLVDDLFMQVRRLSEASLLCYINSDIIMTQALSQAIEVLNGACPPFLAVGHCWDLEVDGEIDFDREEWEVDLEMLVKESGRRRGPFHIDYCVFTRDLFDRLPPFAVGRIRWDNWLVWKALERGGRVIDASGMVRPVHQKHEYGHVDGGKKWSYGGPEARSNQRLAGLARWVHVYGILDATHRLTGNGIEERKVSLSFVRQAGLRALSWLEERRDPARARGHRFAERRGKGRAGETIG